MMRAVCAVPLMGALAYVYEGGAAMFDVKPSRDFLPLLLLGLLGVTGNQTFFLLGG